MKLLINWVILLLTADNSVHQEGKEGRARFKLPELIVYCKLVVGNPLNPHVDTE